MVETTLVRQEVRPEKVDDLRAWMAEVREREDEAVATLRDEGVRTESAFLEETTEGTFLVTYMEAEDLDAVREAFEHSEHDIDEEYKETMRECLVDGRRLGEQESLYHLTHPER